MKVLVADDHPVLRAGVIALVRTRPDVEQVLEAADHKNVVSLVRDQPVDLLVLDLEMPRGDPLDTLAQVRLYRPDLPVLVLSVHPEDDFALRVLQAGAWGYVQKEAATELLHQAIDRLRAGGRYVSEALADRLLTTMQTGSGAPHDRLSTREYQVLVAIARGETTGEIAARLGLSPKTISTYRSRVLEKLGVDNNAGLVRYALSHRLLEGSPEKRR